MKSYPRKPKRPGFIRPRGSKSRLLLLILLKGMRWSTWRNLHYYHQNLDLAKAFSLRSSMQTWDKGNPYLPCLLLLQSESLSLRPLRDKSTLLNRSRIWDKETKILPYLHLPRSKPLSLRLTRNKPINKLRMALTWILRSIRVKVRLWLLVRPKMPPPLGRGWTWKLERKTGTTTHNDHWSQSAWIDAFPQRCVMHILTDVKTELASETSWDKRHTFMPVPMIQLTVNCTTKYSISYTLACLTWDQLSRFGRRIQLVWFDLGCVLLCVQWLLVIRLAIGDWFLVGDVCCGEL